MHFLLITHGLTLIAIFVAGLFAINAEQYNVTIAIYFIMFLELLSTFKVFNIIEAKKKNQKSKE